jgi:predicted MFS family arabinose efflux permease
MIASDGGGPPQLGRLPYALAACFGLSATMITTFPIVAPDVVSEFRLSYAQTGVIAAAYMLGYGLFQLPASFLGISVGSGRVLLGAMMLMSAGALVPCIIDSPSGWVISRLVMGIAGAAVLPLSLHLLTLALSGARLVKGVGITISGWGFGMTLAMLGAAPLLHMVGWRAVMLASAVLGVIVMAGLYWTLPPRNRREEASGTLPGFAQLGRALAGNGALNRMSIINAAATSIMICVPAWLPLYVSGAFHVSTAETAAGLSPIGIGVAVGAWTGGALTIRWGWRPVVITGLLASSVLVASVPLLWSASLIIALAIPIGWIGMFFAAPVQSLFPSVIAEEWTALAAGYYNSIGFFGAFAASLLFGFLVDRTSSFTLGWLFLAMIPIVGVVAALSLAIPARISSTPVP